MFKKWWVLREEAGEGGDTGGGAGGASAEPGSADAGAAADAAKAEAADDKSGAGEAKPIWPEDWRKQIAGEDEKELKQLSRYATPAEVWKKARALEARMSSGELKASLPVKHTDEELAQWRKDNGIPESADKYDLKFDSGLVIGDDDKADVDSFLKIAHDNNLTPNQVKAAIEWNYQQREAAIAERAAQDETDRTSVLDTLNAEWGNEFRQNINMAKGVLDQFPANVRDAMMSARLPDGTAIFNSPDVLRGFVALAREVNPAAALVPTGQGDPLKNVEGRLTEIEKVMREDRKTYNKDQKMQEEYRQLLEAKGRLTERRAA